MALTLGSMTLLKPSRPLGITNHRTYRACQKVLKPLSLLKLKDLTKSFVISKSCDLSAEGMAVAMAMAMACTVLSSLSCNSAMAVQQIADVAEGDNRGLLLLAPVIPAILWVVYNIFEPAVNQINRMRSDK